VRRGQELCNQASSPGDESGSLENQNVRRPSKATSMQDWESWNREAGMHVKCKVACTLHAVSSYHRGHVPLATFAGDAGSLLHSCDLCRDLFLESQNWILGSGFGIVKGVVDE
jgi:hypothetical protein